MSLRQPPRNEHMVEAAASSDHLPLTKKSGTLAITKRMRQPDSGLEVKDRTWLKIKISNAFLGSDLVEWLHTRVEDFQVIIFTFIKFEKYAHILNQILDASLIEKKPSSSPKI